MKHPFLIIVLFFAIGSGKLNAQKEANNWFFGSAAGLNFSTTPPTTLSTGQGVTGSACMSDANGNLLFYTDGITVYNQNHQVMANGTGLLGSAFIEEAALIVKQPLSNNLYYIFTQGVPANQFYNYSIVDMSLAAGLGSVTVKNAPLWNSGGTSYSAILVGTRHCNGVDYWIVTHQLGTALFHSYLLTSAGINTVPVVSVQGNSLCCPQGAGKISSNGKKIAIVNHPQATGGEITINDFDNTTGSVGSNSVVLTGLTELPNGMEFSPNCKLFYANGSIGGVATSTNNGTTIRQWDLCAGNEQAVNASMQVQSAPVGTIISQSTTYYNMQLAPDGKIYVGRNQHWLAVINDPDSLGTASNFVNQGILIYPLVGSLLPNFINSSMRKSPIPVPSQTVSCQSVAFNTSTAALCAASGYSLLSSSWNFGYPTSAASNTSSALSPSHYYTAPGTYTAMFIANYQCTSDTLRQVINIVNADPSFSLAGKTAICTKESATLSASGAYTYSWSTNSTSSSIVVSPTINTQYTVVATNTVNGCKTTQVHTLTVSKCTGLFSPNSEEDGFNIYPNPNDGNFVVETDSKTTQISVYNQLGELVYQGLSDKGKQSINISRFAKGIYFVELHNEKTKRVIKLVKTE